MITAALLLAAYLATGAVAALWLATVQPTDDTDTTDQN